MELRRISHKMRIIRLQVSRSLRNTRALSARTSWPAHTEPTVWGKLYDGRVTARSKTHVAFTLHRASSEEHQCPHKHLLFRSEAREKVLRGARAYV